MFARYSRAETRMKEIKETRYINVTREYSSEVECDPKRRYPTLLGPM